MATRHVIGLVVAALVLGAIAALLPWTRTFLVIAMSKGLAALGITILLRAGQVSFGHAMFFAASAYAAGYASRWLRGTDIVIMLGIGMFAAAVISIAIGAFMVRYRQIFFGMLNLAFSMVLYSILEKFFEITGGTDGLRIGRPTIFGLALDRSGFDLALVLLSIAIALIATIGVQIYFASPLGQALRALKSNEKRLEYIGVSARFVLLVGYVLSAITGAAGGVLLAAMQGLASPSFAYWIQSGEFVFIAILGGGAYPVGAFVGGLIYEGVRIYAAAFAQDTWELILGLVVICIILFAPRGVVGLADDILRWRRTVKPEDPASLQAGPLAGEVRQ